jgi:cytochrome P450
MRRDAPLYRLTTPTGQPLWYVTRYEDVAALLRDKRLVNDMRSALTAEELARLPVPAPSHRFLTNHMLHADPPRHTRLRSLVGKAFSPQRIHKLAPRISELAEALLDEVAPRGEMDLIADFAFPLPITVICELLAVPAADRFRFRDWSTLIVSASQMTRDADVQRVAPELASFAAYLREIIAARRAAPGDDLLSALIGMQEAGDVLSEEELCSMVVLLLVAGHETTVHLIGNSLLTLWQHPQQLARLRQDPALIETAVEELLRYESPVETANRRWAREEIQLHGQTIGRGDLVILVLTSANRDEARFAGAETLDLSRAPNEHLAFGLGIHHCLGAPLARLEGKIALGALLRRFPQLQPAVSLAELQWIRSYFLRGVTRLPVRF